MYVAYIQPLVKKHESKIDNAISEVERSYQTQVRPARVRSRARARAPAAPPLTAPPARAHGAPAAQVVSVLRRNGFGFDSASANSSGANSTSAAAMASQMESGDGRST